MVGEILTTTSTTNNAAVLQRDQSEQVVDPTIRIPEPNQFSYTESTGITRATCIPPTFEFPSETKRLEGWRKWLCGQTFVYEGITWHLPPFRQLKGIHFTAENRKIYHNEWKPIFLKMMETPGLVIPEQVSEQFITESFERATEHLKNNFSYIFESPPDVVAGYRLGTWSKKTKYSQVMKHGTEEDKQKLPPPTASNKKRTPKERSAPSSAPRKRRLPKKL